MGCGPEFFERRHSIYLGAEFTAIEKYIFLYEWSPPGDSNSKRSDRR
ncbi:hypothetical protein SAMN03159306_05693 [Pseudomonas sp. NFACC48-1]|nr:hypothetical protein SAMN03159405_05037 [Pseudomonas sp. NFACC44-2]SDA86512.1 hypothetical protein SAMN03159429_05035 [Pseudomonas sp. NFACC51]SEI79923.1 hypothetical protein SAMN03159298_01463 [Pseudomonas sp. NFACC07-1]SFI54267.1 hypothetical protein SAMN03159302_04340 [Pseudomonas sp. NFACC54]SFT29593.1 hypothetical protein SAMN03159306_05693 [Pseudomonas sp. NFACC48-1]